MGTFRPLEDYLEALTVYNTFKFAAEEKRTLEVIKFKFAKYCMPRKKIVVKSYIFGQCIQNSAETLD